MGEVKSVKVDNWGVFFLQKLQNFFNKTDYCDLTLQFRDNSQLKVHRLVLSACTDYFNVLEQTCDIVDDALIMPTEFQADVVVPIVNFMYTGTLEFELKMYGKLLRTAKEMNMTVLLKLLEAHRRTMENVNRQQRPPSPKGIRRRPMVPSSNATGAQQRGSISTPSNRIGASPGNSNTGRTNVQQPRGINTPAILRSGGISNRTQYGETTSTSTYVKQEPTSPFEQLRKGYNNNKRPAQTSLLSPPSKKPSLEEVKEFAEQQRMRKQIAAEYGDHGDPEYDNMMLYDDVHTGDDDDDDMPPQPSTSKQQQQQTPQQFGGTQTQMEHGTTTIILKQDSPSQTPTIIVKDSSNTKLNHTKIIAEVLRQYPHIVKGHKNIKLKIMPNSPVEKTATAVKRASPAPVGSPAGPTSPHKKLHVSFKPDKPMITTQQQKPTQKLTTTQPTAVEATLQPIASATATSTTTTAASTGQKRRIDSKTMHTLIALGAENTTGPWLCLRCGVNGRPISIPSYRGFRRHLINTHKETIDPALCEHCGWRSANNRELHFHMYTEHQIKSLLYNFAECALCNQTYLTKSELEQHINEAHTDENKQQCIYCSKVFAQELQLYRHMKNYHKAQALEDGIIDETDEEYLGSQDEDEQLEDEEQEEEEVDDPMQDEKVRILSDISLPATSAIVQQQTRDEPDEGAVTEADTEEEQIMQSPTPEQEVKFVGADGNEVELTEEQRKEILSQLNQQQAGAPSGGVVMVLSEPEVDAKQEGDVKSLTGTEEEYDDSQIYSELAATGSVESSSKKSEAADESKESIDNLEWAENLISKHDLETDQNSKEPKAEKGRDDISEKLKELTGEWTEDENEDEDDIDDKPATSELAAVVQTEKNTEKQAASTVAEAAEEATEEPEPEDDIDLALESLHKGDGEETETIAKETAPTNTSSTTEISQDEPDAAAEIVADDLQKSIKDEDDVKKERETEEEFIKEDAPTTIEAVAEGESADINNEIAAENSADAVVSTGVDDVNLETENIRKVLIDELIAEAKTPDADVDPDAVTGEQPELTEVSPTQLPEVDGSETQQADATKAIEAVEESIENNNEKRAEETTAVDEASAATDEKPNTSDAVEVDGKAEPLTAGTQEKLKSLMNEWVDDDDDDNEDENGVTAAAKEQL